MVAARLRVVFEHDDRRVAPVILVARDGLDEHAERQIVVGDTRVRGWSSRRHAARVVISQPDNAEGRQPVLPGFPLLSGDPVEVPLPNHETEHIGMELIEIREQRLVRVLECRFGGDCPAGQAPVLVQQGKQRDGPWIRAEVADSRMDKVRRQLVALPQPSQRHFGGLEQNSPYIQMVLPAARTLSQMYPPWGVSTSDWLCWTGSMLLFLPSES